MAKSVFAVDYKGRSYVVNYRTKSDFTMMDHSGNTIEGRNLITADRAALGKVHDDTFGADKILTVRRVAMAVGAAGAAIGTALYFWL